MFSMSNFQKQLFCSAQLLGSIAALESVGPFCELFVSRPILVPWAEESSGCVTAMCSEFGPV